MAIPGENPSRRTWLAGLINGRHLDEVAHRHRAFERVATLLGIFCAIGPISTDIYLPAFPQLERDLNAAPGSASLTLSTWMFGLALGQAVIGPLSDRFGRRAVMFWGMFAYCFSSAACALSPSLTFLAIARFFAAVAAAACIVVPSASVRDFAEGNRASALMSRLILIQGAVPILAPMLGGFVLAWVSWRAVFWLSLLYGAVCCSLLIFIFPETLPSSRRTVLHPIALLERFKSIVREPVFRRGTLIYGLSGFIFFAYLTAAPDIFQRLYRFSPAHYGMIFGICAIGMIGAAQLNGSLVSRVSNARMTGGAIIVVISSLFLLLTVTMVATRHADAAGHLRAISLPPFLALLFFTLAMGGIISPNAIVQALRHHNHHAGSATALAGTTQYVFGAVASLLIGVLPNTSPIPMVTLMLGAALIMALVAVKKS